jgi:NADH:ubiquinone reductase (H+-translocating)
LIARPMLLGQFSSKAHEYALRKLTEVGADVKLKVGVTVVHPDRVEFDDKATILSRTVVWGGGESARQSRKPSGRSSVAADGSRSDPT